MSNVSNRTKKLVLASILSAICIVLGLTPLGFIPIGPVKATILHIPVILGALFGGPIVGVIVGLVFGIMSFLQAPTDPTFSVIWAIGGLREFFLIAVTAIAPRVLIGLVAAYTYKLARKIPEKVSLIIMISVELLFTSFIIFKLVSSIKNSESYWIYILLLIAIIIIFIFSFKIIGKKYTEVALATALGTLTNTILFIACAYFFFVDQHMEIFALSRQGIRDIWITAALTNGVLEIIISVLIVTTISTALLKNKQDLI